MEPPREGAGGGDSSIGSEIGEIQQLAALKGIWHGKEISQSAPKLKPILDRLTARAEAGELHSLDVANGRLLFDALTSLTENIETANFADVEKKATLAKIQTVLSELDPALFKKRKREEVPIEIKKYDSLDAMRSDLGAIVKSLQDKPVSDATLDALFALFDKNWECFEKTAPSRNEESVIRFFGLFVRATLPPELHSGVIGRALAFKMRSIDLHQLTNIGFSWDELLNSAPYVKTLRLSSLGKADNEAIFEFIRIAKNIEDLIIYSCDDISGDIFAELVNKKQLKSLSFFDCILTEPLPPTMPQLQKLVFSACRPFNQPLPAGMGQLRTLEIRSCYQFNSPLPTDMHQLQELSIKSCNSFNQPIPVEMFSLPHFELERHPSFAFQVFTHPTQNQIVFAKYDFKGCSQMWEKLTPSEREQCIQALLNDPRAMELIESSTAYMPILDIMKIREDLLPKRLVMQNTLVAIQRQVQASPIDDETINTLYSSLRERRDFLDCLSEMLRSFPPLTAYMIQNHQEEIAKDIDRTAVSLGTLNTESRLALLPLLPADAIQRTVTQDVTPAERRSWQNQRLEFDEFSGSVSTVLSRIKRDVLDRQGNLEPIRPALIEMIKGVSFLSLSSLCFDEMGLKLVMTFIDMLSAAQLACTIPFLPKEVLIDYLKKLPDFAHAQYLAYATKEQRGHYLDSDIFAAKLFLNWEQEIKTKLDQLVDACNADPKDEIKQATLEQELAKAKAMLHPAIHRYTMALNSLKIRLLATNPSVEGYVQTKQNQMQLIQDHLAKLVVSRSSVEAPNEFYDLVSSTIMKEPYMYRNFQDQTLDKETWDGIIARGQTNPFNRQPVTPADLSPNEELKKRIREHQGQGGP